MKKSTSLLVLLLAFNSFAQKEAKSNYLLFSGKIENPFSDSVLILDKNQDVMKVILLKKDHSFRDTLRVEEGFYSLLNGQERTKMYLKPTFDLYVTLNTNEFDETIKYKGKGANENNYLSKNALLNESFGQLNYYGYYAKLDEKEFLNLTDSLYVVQKNLLEATKNLDPDFLYLESNSLKYNKLMKYVNYESMRRFVTGDREFKVSESYPNPFEKVNLGDEKLVSISEYIQYIQSYIRKKASEGLTPSDKPVDYTWEYVKAVKSEINSPLLKELLLYKVGKNELTNAIDIDRIFKEINPSLTNEDHRNEVTAAYTKIKKTQKGEPSPLFELNDINGKTVSLNDLKGKLVYIDIWATWCMPCIKEIPSLLKLEESFHGRDIQFVSICIEDSEERWRKMVEEKNLGGIQLFAPTNEIPFIQDYSVDGIPRFILIDQEGKIIDPNAKRPSNEELAKEIEGYL
jgi:thiol-disulfide isomerase/thioredoxin